MRVAAIIPAAGSGKRMGRPKQWLPLAGRPLLSWTLAAFENCPAIDDIVLVVPEADIERARREVVEPFGLSKVRCVVAGGEERQDSVLNGFRALPGRPDLVMVHDGARPLVSREVLERAIEATASHGATLCAVPARDTLKRVDEGGVVLATVDRDAIWQAQTPQTFRYELLEAAFERALREGVRATDEAGLVERLGHPVRVVLGSRENFKVTAPEDIALAERILVQEDKLRIGMGYDSHRLTRDRKLILGGVEIPFELGLAGHSDADVLAHAISDALLGAAALGDIGTHFPETDDRWRGADSLKMLAQITQLVRDKGFEIMNVDATVRAQRPKLAAHIPLMRERLAAAMKIDVDKVSVKAKTEEGLGPVGRGEMIGAQAVALLK
jgi:2-C-methyl-D-erythritol 4-phosphate cytidylyltransferase/2-C-methyl-D-erythritol 2,4-cyclodiphosphate synthase